MNSKLDLALLFRQLTTVHANIAPKDFSTPIVDLPLLMIQKVALFMLPAVRDESTYSIEHKLSSLVTIMELDEIRNAFSTKAINLDATKSPWPNGDSLHTLSACLLELLLTIEKMRGEYGDIVEAAKANYNGTIKMYFNVIANRLGGMHLVVRAQIILCTWKVVKQTHPVVEEQHGSMTPPEVIRLLPDVLTDMPLQEDVPAMIADVGDALIQRLGMAEKV